MCKSKNDCVNTLAIWGGISSRTVLAVTALLDEYGWNTEGNYFQPCWVSLSPGVVLSTHVEFLQCFVTLCVRTALWSLWATCPFHILHNTDKSTVTLEMILHAFSNQVSEWHEYFKTSQVSAQEDSHSQNQPPAKQKIWKILKLIQEDHCWTIHHLSHVNGISYGVCQETITKYLNMHCTAAKSVTWLLILNHKQ